MAAVIAGVAAWFSRGTFDVAGTAAEPRRVAMLPSWPELIGLVMLAILIVTALALLRTRARSVTAPDGLGHRPQGTDAAATLLSRTSVPRAASWDAALADAMRPLFILPVLILPYVPWLPDTIPALQVLAGPFRWLLWGVVLGQLAWALAPRLRLPTIGVGVASFVVFVTSVVVYGCAARQLTKTPYYPGGDEPHYLIITQSLLRDHDLAIENNHQRGDFREYFPFDLAPDYRTRGIDGRIYSIHPVGLPVLAMPAFALAGYRGVVWLLIAIAGVTATMVWRWTRSVVGSGAATFAWAAVCLSGPYVFNSFTIYPEIPAACCVVAAIAAAARTEYSSGSGVTTRRLIFPALAVAALPWLSTKYVVLAVVLSAVLAWRQHRWASTFAIVAPLVVSLVSWLTFFYLVWGSPLPSAPYGPDPQMNLKTFMSGGPGLWFDQEYGLIAYAPVLILGLIGLAMMGRERPVRRLAFEIGASAVSLLILVGSFALWWGGAAGPGRPVIALLPLLGPPIGWCYRRAEALPARRAACQLLLLMSLAEMHRIRPAWEPEHALAGQRAEYVNRAAGYQSKR